MSDHALDMHSFLQLSPVQKLFIQASVDNKKDIYFTAELTSSKPTQLHPSYLWIMVDGFI